MNHDDPPEILLVDDVEENLEVLANMLSTDQWDLAFATNGEEALAQLEAHLPQLILLDVNMPGMDGFEVCERLKANPLTATLPVIFLTGRTATADLVKGLEMGAVDYVTKPFQREELLARVNTHLDLALARSTIDRQHQRMQQQLDALQRLNALSVDLQQADNENHLLQLIRTHLEGFSPPWRGEITLYNTRDELPSVFYWGHWETPPASGFPLTQSLSDTPPSLSVDEAYLIHLPLRHQHHTLGSLRLWLHDADFDEAMATTAASLVSLALYNLRLRAELQHQAIHDPLTGLYNRRFLSDQLSRELRRAERESQPLALLMADLDFFKSINDRFGHATGDEVLISLARLLGENLRTEDIVCRTGGEEFVVVLPRTPPDAAHARAESLRAAISEMVVEHAGQRLDTISASIGIALFPQHASNAETLMQRADEALYRAKTTGRNQVIISDGHVSVG